MFGPRKPRTTKATKTACNQGYIFWPFPISYFKEDLKKGREKGGKEEKKKSDKTHVKIPL